MILDTLMTRLGADWKTDRLEFGADAPAPPPAFEKEGSGGNPRTDTVAETKKGNSPSPASGSSLVPDFSTSKRDQFVGADVAHPLDVDWDRVTLEEAAPELRPGAGTGRHH